MILPDVTVLVYGFRRDSGHFPACSRWLDEVVNGGEELALSETVLTGFVRIVTNGRVFARPTTTSVALRFVDQLRGSPIARTPIATAAVWDTFAALAADDPLVRGNLVPDAWLAALAISHGARIATTDRGFARYPGLQLVDPTRD